MDIRVLGLTEVEGLSGPPALGGVLPRTVLGLLVLDLSRDLDQDVIQEQLWPDQPPRRKSAQVFSLVSNLRKALGDDIFPRTRGRYRLSIEAAQVDLHRFERGIDEGFALADTAPAEAEVMLRRTLGEWRGEPFADMAPEVERLIDAKRALEVKYLSARRALIDLSLGLGRQRELIPELVDLTDRFPGEASFWVSRMTVHARLGEWETAEALTAEAAKAHGALGVPLAESIKSCARLVEERDPIFASPNTARPPAVASRTDRSNVVAATDVRRGVRQQAAPLPYKGLASYQPEDKADFFGREAITTRFLSIVRSDGFLTVAGPSGSGKSSIVRAGVVGSLLDDPEVSVHLMTPGDDPVGSFAAWWPRDRRATVVEELRAAPDAVEHLLDEIIPTDAESEVTRSVLVVDQFEEVFTQTDAAGRATFIAVLRAMQRVEHAGVVLAVRADFAGRCAEHDGLRRLVNRTWQLVGPLSVNEMRRAIEDPAHRAGITIEPGLVDRIIADADPEHELGSLPLVSHALFETCSLSPPNTLTHVAYQQAGGVRAAIARTADRIFDLHFDADQRSLADELLPRMVAAQSNGPDVRRLVPLDEIERTPGLIDVVHELADARLVTLTDEGAQIAHEALITRWPRLVQLLRTHADDLRFEQRLETDVTAWVATPSTDLLYRGRPLEHLIGWSERRRFTPAPDIERFREASRKDAGRRQWGRRAATASALVATAAIVFAIGFGVSRFNAGAAEDAAREQAEGAFVEIGGRSVSFQLRTTEVTNADYRHCVDFSACPAPRERVDVVDGVLVGTFADGDPTHPVRNISADEASRFCEWIGAELPQVTDFLRALVGDGDRRFPWGDEPFASGELADASVDLGGEPAVLRSVDDDTRRSVDGITHLLGNVAEWTATPDPERCTGNCDPAVAWTRTNQSALGLQVLAPNIYARTRPAATDWFGAREATSVSEDLGFRCARL